MNIVFVTIYFALALMTCQIVVSQIDLRDYNSHSFKFQSSPWPSPTDPFPYRVKFLLPKGGQCESFTICYQSQMALPIESGAKWAKSFTPPAADEAIGEICAKTKTVSTDQPPSRMNANLHGIQITVDSKAIRLTTSFDRHEILVHADGSTAFMLELWHNGETMVTKLLEENDGSEKETIVRDYRNESPKGAHLQDYTGLWLLGLDMQPRESDTVTLLINQTADCDLIPLFFEPTDFDDLKTLEEDEQTPSSSPAPSPSTIHTTTKYCNITLKRAKPLCGTIREPGSGEYFCAVQQGWMLSDTEWVGKNEEDFEQLSAEIRQHLSEISDPKRNQWRDLFHSVVVEGKWKNYSDFQSTINDSIRPYLLNNNWGMPALLHFHHAFFVDLNPNWVLDDRHKTKHLVELFVHECTLPGNPNISIQFASAVLNSSELINRAMRNWDFDWAKLSESLKKCQQKYDVLNDTEEYIVKPNAEYIVSNINDRTFRRKSTLKVGFTMEDNASLPDRETLQFFEYLFGGLAHLGLQHNDQYSQGPVDPHWKLADYEAEALKFGGHFLVPAALAIMPAKNYPVEVNFTASKWTNDEATNWKGEKFGDLYKEKLFGIVNGRPKYVNQAQKCLTQLVASCYMLKNGQGQFDYEIRTGRLRLIEVVERYPNLLISLNTDTVDFIYAQYPAGKDPSIAGIRIDGKQLQQKPKQLNGSSIDNGYPLEMDAYAYGYGDEIDDDK